VQKLATSKYLRLVQRDDGWGAYHSLFGNLSLLDADGKRFLEAFGESATIDEASEAFGEQPGDALRSYANDLIIRGFLVPEGSDEYSIVEDDERMRKERLQTGYLVRALQLVTINSCNYACKYCFMNLQGDDRADSRDIGTAVPMSAEVADASMRELIGVLKRNGNDYLNVEFFGGEPLMNWPVIEHVLETFGNEHDGINILYSITTNGALITPHVAEVFRRYGVTVTVSVDVPTRVQGLKLVMAKPADRVEDALAILRDHCNKVTFNAVISKETIDFVDERKLLDVAKEYDVGVVGLILDLDLPFYRDAERRERALGILMDTYRYGREIGVHVTGYWHQMFNQITGKQAINLRSGYKTCPATGCKVSVEPDGSIYTCKCTSGELGHVSDLEEVLASETYGDYAMAAYRHAPECEGCEIEGFCSGVCMGSFENEFGRKDMIETGACDMFRRITRELIADLPAAEAPTLRLDERS
jgi:uncharacterized protein